MLQAPLPDPYAHPTDDPRSLPEAECARLAPRLPAQWNSRFNSYAFVYAHTQSAMTFVVRVGRLSSRAEVTAVAVGDERIARFDVVLREYVNNSGLPVKIKMVSKSEGGATGANPSPATAAAAPETASDAAAAAAGDSAGPAASSTTLTGGTSAGLVEDRSTLAAAIEQAFLGRASLSALAGLLKINVVQALLPSLQKGGYEETRRRVADPDDADAEAAARDDERRSGPAGRVPLYPALPPGPAPPNPYGIPDPLAGGPDDLPRPGQGSRLPVPAGDFPPPGFEDEYEIGAPPRGGGRVGGGGLIMPGTGGRGGQQPPFGIGHDDLYPAGLGPHDPLRGGLGPFGPGGGGFGGGGGGMHPTFDDPLFMGGGGGGGAGPQPGGPQNPAGARWDPVVPGGGPRGGRRAGGQGGGNNPFGFGDII